MKQGFLRFLMGACLVASLIGVLTYLKISFDGADRATAIRLVHEAIVDGKPLSQRIAAFLPASEKVCYAEALRAFFGHMKVRCVSTRVTDRELAWQVGLADGMVRPDNEATARLGRGEKPW